MDFLTMVEWMYKGIMAYIVAMLLVAATIFGGGLLLSKLSSPDGSAQESSPSVDPAILQQRMWDEKQAEYDRCSNELQRVEDRLRQRAEDRALDTNRLVDTYPSFDNTAELVQKRDALLSRLYELQKNRLY